MRQHEPTRSQPVSGSPARREDGPGGPVSLVALQAAGNQAVQRLFDGVAVQRSPLSERVAATGADKGRAFDILREVGPVTDPDLDGWINAHFPAGTDDRWLAERLVRYGAEPRWPYDEIVERQRRAQTNHWAPEPGNIAASFDAGPGRVPVTAYYFPGRTDRRAMVIGGVHGTEAAGVEVANMLLERLRRPGAPMPLLSVIVVPVLFPENLAAHQRKTPGHVDPNRQMPALGASPGAVDSEGRPVEAGNRILLDLIERFRPERIASCHGHGATGPHQRDTPPSSAGEPSITSDPRPGHETEDDKLALDMARRASSVPGGARVPGNRLGERTETARYPTSSAPHDPGVSFGAYGSHAAGARPAMNVITIETFGNATSAEARDPAARRVELQSLATVLDEIFLNQ
ncbi:hypothetical protein JOF56_006891 [Kibdelosporangium banguiense]|uniref:Peptidase M14 carboxypeptidase A domain-containing protein n=1 Tax=Kibdelosporangium banguiense TaxID=1365924 RepID=A0ABS4TQ24_9PSEU|nr:hypothetical protein [Kibdelosporangium banguiense]MBP2326506.1 hypothetical protein [Kibdelosporangium banguiense]